MSANLESGLKHYALGVYAFLLIYFKAIAACSNAIAQWQYILLIDSVTIFVC